MLWRQWRQGIFMLAVWIGLVIVRIALKLLGYRRLSSWLLRLSPQPTQEAFNPRARVAASLIEKASIWSMGFRKASCLHRSLLLWWYLRLMGISSELKTGIRRTPSGELLVHAWVEHCGLVINDRREVVIEYALLWSNLSPEKISQHKVL